MASNPSWGSWVELHTGQSITNGSSFTSDAISGAGKIATEVGVVIDYGATATEGCEAFPLAEIDDSGNYQTIADLPAGARMAYSTSTTYHVIISFDVMNSRKIGIRNNSGATVTGHVYYRQAVLA